jgi:hypothetical protein
MLRKLMDAKYKTCSGWELYRYFAWFPTFITWTARGRGENGPIGKWVWLKHYYANCWNEDHTRQETIDLFYKPSQTQG